MTIRQAEAEWRAGRCPGAPWPDRADPTLTRMEIEMEAEVSGLGERDFRALAGAADHARRTHQVTTETTS
jgi:hypothetical protein